MRPGWIDAHCHLSDPRIAADLDRVLDECANHGITRFVLGGVDPKDWQRQRELDERYPGKFVRVYGLHPWWVHDLIAHNSSRDEHVASPDNSSRDEFATASATFHQAIMRLESEVAQCAALGETGLDNARDRFKHSRELQLQAFEAQLALAQKHRKPLVLHIVKAHALALETLERRKPANGGLVHSFSGAWADARRYLDLGLTLSVSARVTYPDAADLHETVRKAPADRLVFETDAPDQPPYGAPVTPAGKLHTPLSLLKVVQKVSEIRGESPESPELWLDRSRDKLVRLFAL
jgi:TatD DNase family protein